MTTENVTVVESPAQTVVIQQSSLTPVFTAVSAVGSGLPEAYGTKKLPGETIAVNDLVFQDGEDVYLAQQSSTTRRAMGVVSRVVGDTIYHVSQKVADNITIAGTPVPGLMILYLDDDGGVTFDMPAYASNTKIRQLVGFVMATIGGGNYAAFLTVSAGPMVV